MSRERDRPGGPAAEEDHDRRFREWRARNPGGLFSEYFAAVSVPRIRTGAPHDSLGRNLRAGDWRHAGEAPFALTRRIWCHLTGQADLPRDLRLCDYGCGTLRVGAPLMQHLAPGHYTGLDISADLLALGRESFAGLVAEKRPLLVAMGRDFDPASVPPADLVICYNVACHIHPEERETFFARLRALAAQPGALVLLHVIVHAEALRFQPSGWADRRAAWIAAMAPLEPVEHPFEHLKDVHKAGHDMTARVLAFRRG